ncbi:MAG: DNA-binding protein [Campylobacterales bacterium]|nr:DNA-binding protein [Campylobacterales bacterium]
MAKLSVAQAAEKFNVSKEAIHNRIRRGSLDCVIEHGVKHVLIDEQAQPKEEPQESKYYAYIEDENISLKEKIKELEKLNSTLRNQKEMMLIEEKKKIEQIYKERDEQLKQLLNTITSKFLPHLEQRFVDEKVDDVVDVEALSSEPIRLKRFLKLKDYKSAKNQRIKNRFKRLVGQDERVVRKEGKIYVDPVKYDYRDLLE